MLVQHFPRQGGHNVLSPVVKIVTLPFIIIVDNTEGLYKLFHVHVQCSFTCTSYIVSREPQVSSGSVCAPSLSWQRLIACHVLWDIFSSNCDVIRLKRSVTTCFRSSVVLQVCCATISSYEAPKGIITRQQVMTSRASRVAIQTLTTIRCPMVELLVSPPMVMFTRSEK